MQKMGDINGVFRRFFRMVLVAQLARASGCGPEGRRFEPDRAHPPFSRNSNELRDFFALFAAFLTSCIFRIFKYKSDVSKWRKGYQRVTNLLSLKTLLLKAVGVVRIKAKGLPEDAKGLPATRQ